MQNIANIPKPSLPKAQMQQALPIGAHGIGPMCHSLWKTELLLWPDFIFLCWKLFFLLEDHCCTISLHNCWTQVTPVYTWWFPSFLVSIVTHYYIIKCQDSAYYEVNRWPNFQLNLFKIVSDMQLILNGNLYHLFHEPVNCSTGIQLYCCSLRWINSPIFGGKNCLWCASNTSVRPMHLSRGEGFNHIDAAWGDGTIFEDINCLQGICNTKCVTYDTSFVSHLMKAFKSGIDFDTDRLGSILM